MVEDSHSDARQRRHPFIAIEGCDGSGKSTVARLLAQRIGGSYEKTPPDDYAGMRPFYEATDRAPEARFMFYLGADWDAWKRLQGLLHERPVVIDRYTLSTRIYHEVLTGRALSEQMRTLAPPEPDITIILTASVGTVAQRLTMKTGAFDALLEHNELFQQEVRSRYEHAVGYKVKTDDLSIDQVVDRCEQVVRIPTPGSARVSRTSSRALLRSVR